MYAHPYVRPTQ